MGKLDPDADAQADVNAARDPHARIDGNARADSAPQQSREMRKRSDFKCAGIRLSDTC